MSWPPPMIAPQTLSSPAGAQLFPAMGHSTGPIAVSPFSGSSAVLIKGGQDVVRTGPLTTHGQCLRCSGIIA